MTTYAFPNITPNRTTWEYISNVEAFESALSRTIQTADRGGEHWRCSLTFNNLRGAERAIMKAFLVRLNGRQHRFTLPDHALNQRGGLAGSPVVNGAGQTGVILNITGCTGGADWIMAGDMFEVNGELKMCVVDADEAAGDVSIEFRPRLMTAPPNSDPIEVTAPTGKFMLLESASGWSNDPGGFSSLTIVCREDNLP